MKQLVIIGNGFDKAHGLPTSYSEFIQHYLMKCYSEACDNNGGYSDDNLEFFLSTQFSEDHNGKSIEKYYALLRECKANFKNKFLERIISKVNQRYWVDIEMDYFDMLSVLGDQFLRRSKNTRLIKALNEDLQGIKVLLQNYLNEIVEPIIRETKLYFLNEFQIINNRRESNEETLFLNFNYTSTLDAYVNELDNTKCIYIHGKLNQPKNPIIFGFGDEQHKKYELIESLNENLFLKNIKTFKYLLTNNYRDLTMFLESFDEAILPDEEFEVSIFGHSCGMSDGTLLNHIFDRDNCKGISIYYHKNQEDFIERSNEISRHFKSKNKNNLRLRINPFEDSKPCPQYEDLLDVK